MSSPQQIESLTTVFVDQPPSCLEFCPTAPDYFVVGTYLLTETGHGTQTQTQTKSGTLKLFKLDTTSFQLENIQSIELPYAVFDLHFSPDNGALFGIVTSAGIFETYTIETSNGAAPVLEHRSTIRIHDDPSIPALYFDWAPRTLTWRRDADTTAFAVSFSDGTVSIFHTNPPDHAINEDKISKTSFPGSLMEIWDVKLTTTGNPGAETPLLLFGDDFSTLRAFEFDPDGEWADGEFPTKIKEFNDKGKFHEAGVTAILPLYHDDNGAMTLLTGSYDECVRVYCYQGRGSVLAEKSLGGGVWRLKLLKTEPATSTGGSSYLILASCMHAGARVLRITATLENDWNIEVLAEFSEHESMNYASEIWRGESIETGRMLGSRSETDMLFVSSSFYDKRLCVWKFDTRK